MSTSSGQPSKEKIKKRKAFAELRRVDTVSKSPVNPLTLFNQFLNSEKQTNVLSLEDFLNSIPEEFESPEFSEALHLIYNKTTNLVRHIFKEFPPEFQHITRAYIEKLESFELILLSDDLDLRVKNLTACLNFSNVLGPTLMYLVNCKNLASKLLTRPDILQQSIPQEIGSAQNVTFSKLFSEINILFGIKSEKNLVEHSKTINENQALISLLEKLVNSSPVADLTRLKLQFIFALTSLISKQSHHDLYIEVMEYLGMDKVKSTKKNSTIIKQSDHLNQSYKFFEFMIDSDIVENSQIAQELDTGYSTLGNTYYTYQTSSVPNFKSRPSDLEYISKYDLKKLQKLMQTLVKDVMAFSQSLSEMEKQQTLSEKEADNTSILDNVELDNRTLAAELFSIPRKEVIGDLLKQAFQVLCPQTNAEILMLNKSLIKWQTFIKNKDFHIPTHLVEFVKNLENLMSVKLSYDVEGKSYIFPVFSVYISKLIEYSYPAKPSHTESVSEIDEQSLLQRLKFKSDFALSQFKDYWTQISKPAIKRKILQITQTITKYGSFAEYYQKVRSFEELGFGLGSKFGENDRNYPGAVHFDISDSDRLFVDFKTGEVIDIGNPNYHS